MSDQPTHVCVWYHATSVTVLRGMTDGSALRVFYEEGQRSSSQDANLFRLSDNLRLACWVGGEFCGPPIPTDIEQLAAAHNNTETR